MKGSPYRPADRSKRESEHPAERRDLANPEQERPLQDIESRIGQAPLESLNQERFQMRESLLDSPLQMTQLLFEVFRG